MQNYFIKKILIDYRTIIGYQSYYIYGFSNLLNLQVEFSLLDINIKNHQDYRRGSAWQIQYFDGEKKNLYIDTNDRNDINESFYNWCDLYAKINVDSNDLTREKLYPIGPSFAIRIWNPIQTMCYALKNRLNWKSGYTESWRTYIKDYGYMFVRRLPFSNYHIKCKEDRNYMFALHTLWYDEETYANTNRLRGYYTRACKDLFPIFEGGFFYIPGVVSTFPKYREYERDYGDLIIKKRISMREYITKIERASFVFNTPSVCGCHGWKLAEYLAMGKAIISTHLNNVMPGNFLPGKHYIEANTEKEIYSAVNSLYNNPQLIEELKNESRKYFDTYLAPLAVVKHILERLKG